MSEATQLVHANHRDTHASLYEMQDDIGQLRKAGVEGSNGMWMTLEEATRLVRDGISRLQSAQSLRERKRHGVINGGSRSSGSDGVEEGG